MNDRGGVYSHTDEKFELEGVRLKMMTNKNYNVDLANLLDKIICK